MGQDRKHDHIQLAAAAQTPLDGLDARFAYEPMLAAHPDDMDLSLPFLGKRMGAPLWLSSLTGGTGMARDINRNLARACRAFGLGMGLGSCRKLIFEETCREDFDLRAELGDDRPFYANVGIAQVEELLTSGRAQALADLVGTLRADGLIVHVNPLQEWLQPEGNRMKQPPLETLRQLMDRVPLKLIVKEVGQGFGPASLRELLRLPLEAIEFGAYGGTNFAKLELLRAEPRVMEANLPLVYVGHSALQMVEEINQLLESGPEPACRQIIISGGIRNALDGYHLISLSRLPSVFGMASAVLAHAAHSYGALKAFLDGQLRMLRVARAFLRVNPRPDGR